MLWDYYHQISKISYKTTIIKTIWFWSRTDIQISGTETRIQKHKLFFFGHWILTKMPRKFHGVRNILAVNGPGTTGRAYAINKKQKLKDIPHTINTN